MGSTLVWRTLVVLAALLPFILFQGLPGLAPAWLAAKFFGVPATAWLGAAGFVMFVALTWIFAREARS